MKYLDALCCDGCRAKVAEIEARDEASHEAWFGEGWENGTALFTAWAVRDRRTLLAMVEALLGGISELRVKHKAFAGEALKLLTEERAVVLARLQQETEAALVAHGPAGEP